MGRTYLFECPKCSYRARVAGRAERGIHFAVQTILCHECRELYDAVIALQVLKSPGLTNALAQRKSLPSPPTFQTALNRLPPPANRALRWKHFKPACPVFAGHRIREWQAPDKCPKCGCHLERNALPFRLWD